MTWLLNPRLLAITAILISLAGSAWLAYSKGRQSGMSQIQTLWDAERAVQLAAQAEEQMKARQTEQALQAAVNRIRKEKTREAIKLAADYAVVIDSLHDREDRPSGDGLPEGSGAGAGPAGGCTGAQLYKPDAAVLVGIARDADQLRLALKACVTHAAEVERELNRTTKAPDSAQNE
jgi:hypothetical protein